MFTLGTTTFAKIKTKSLEELQKAEADLLEAKYFTNLKTTYTEKLTMLANKLLDAMSKDISTVPGILKDIDQLKSTLRRDYLDAFVEFFLLGTKHSSEMGDKTGATAKFAKRTYESDDGVKYRLLSDEEMVQFRDVNQLTDQQLLRYMNSNTPVNYLTSNRRGQRFILTLRFLKQNFGTTIQAARTGYATDNKSVGTNNLRDAKRYSKIINKLFAEPPEVFAASIEDLKGLDVNVKEGYKQKAKARREARDPLLEVLRTNIDNLSDITTEEINQALQGNATTREQERILNISEQHNLLKSFAPSLARDRKSFGPKVDIIPILLPGGTVRYMSTEEIKAELSRDQGPGLTAMPEERQRLLSFLDNKLTKSRYKKNVKWFTSVSKSSQLNTPESKLVPGLTKSPLEITTDRKKGTKRYLPGELRNTSNTIRKDVLTQLDQLATADQLGGDYNRLNMTTDRLKFVESQFYVRYLTPRSLKLTDQIGEQETERIRIEVARYLRSNLPESFSAEPKQSRPGKNAGRGSISDVELQERIDDFLAGKTKVFGELKNLTVPRSRNVDPAREQIFINRIAGTYGTVINADEYEKIVTDWYATPAGQAQRELDDRLKEEYEQLKKDELFPEYVGYNKNKDEIDTLASKFKKDIYDPYFSDPESLLMDILAIDLDDMPPFLTRLVNDEDIVNTISENPASVFNYIKSSAQIATIYQMTHEGVDPNLATAYSVKSFDKKFNKQILEYIKESKNEKGDAFGTLTDFEVAKIEGFLEQNAPGLNKKLGKREILTTPFAEYATYANRMVPDALFEGRDSKGRYKLRKNVAGIDNEADLKTYLDNYIAIKVRPPQSVVPITEQQQRLLPKGVKTYTKKEYNKLQLSPLEEEARRQLVGTEGTLNTTEQQGIMQKENKPYVVSLDELLEASRLKKVSPYDAEPDLIPVKKTEEYLAAKARIKAINNLLKQTPETDYRFAELTDEKTKLNDTFITPIEVLEARKAEISTELKQLKEADGSKITILGAKKKAGKKGRPRTAREILLEELKEVNNELFVPLTDEESNVIYRSAPNYKQKVNIRQKYQNVPYFSHLPNRGYDADGNLTPEAEKVLLDIARGNVASQVPQVELGDVAMNKFNDIVSKKLGFSFLDEDSNFVRLQDNQYIDVKKYIDDVYSANRKLILDNKLPSITDFQTPAEKRDNSIKYAQARYDEYMSLLDKNIVAMFKQRGANNEKLLTADGTLFNPTDQKSMLDYMRGYRTRVKSFITEGNRFAKKVDQEYAKQIKRHSVSFRSRNPLFAALNILKTEHSLAYNIGLIDFVMSNSSNPGNIYFRWDNEFETNVCKQCLYVEHLPYILSAQQLADLYANPAITRRIKDLRHPIIPFHPSCRCRWILTDYEPTQEELDKERKMPTPEPAYPEPVKVKPKKVLEAGPEEAYTTQVEQATQTVAEAEESVTTPKDTPLEVGALAAASVIGVYLGYKVLGKVNIIRKFLQTHAPEIKESLKVTSRLFANTRGVPSVQELVDATKDLRPMVYNMLPMSSRARALIKRIAPGTFEKTLTDVFSDLYDEYGTGTNNAEIIAAMKGAILELQKTDVLPSATALKIPRLPKYLTNVEKRNENLVDDYLSIVDPEYNSKSKRFNKPKTLQALVDTYRIDLDEIQYIVSHREQK